MKNIIFRFPNNSEIVYEFNINLLVRRGDSIVYSAGKMFYANEIIWDMKTMDVIVELLTKPLPTPPNKEI